MDDPNVRHVGACCAPKPRPEFATLPPEFFIGRNVKLAFDVYDGDDRVTVEHMWVTVDNVIEGEHLSGLLASVPLYIDPDRLDLGDRVNFVQRDIEDVYADGEA